MACRAGCRASTAHSYDDDVPYTPAWQEKFTGIHRDTLLRFAREWGENAEKTHGKNLIIIGAGANHWYHNNLLYRSGIVALMLTGSVGVNGGGLAHYVGQEKLANQASWSALPLPRIGAWLLASRIPLPSIMSTRTSGAMSAAIPLMTALPGQKRRSNKEHTIDMQVRAVRRGWLPFFPQFNRSSLEVAKEAIANGAKN